METTEEEFKQSQSDSWDSLVLTRDEANCKDEDLELWKIKLKGLLDRIKSSEFEQIVKSFKPERGDLHIVDAFLVVLGHRTKEERNQVLKDFNENKVDLLKQTELVKYQEITFDDCKQIQSLLVNFTVINTKFRFPTKNYLRNLFDHEEYLIRRCLAS